GTEDEHIVINRESGKERIRLVDDEDLACIIWSQGFKVDLPIVLDTSQQPFSSWRFDKMKSLFGLKADDYNELPTFAGGVKETPEEIQNLVIGEFLRLHKTSQHITSANEATRCEYISRIIYGVASIYGELDAFFQKYQIALEVQGAQHRFHSTSWYKDVKKLEDIVNRDRQKRCICLDNGIFLLEVWYDQNPEIVIPERIRKIKEFVNQASKSFDFL
ncbi:hypothetical protein RhiirA1_504617, partial [Rhizophagus irregularis]